MIHAMILTQPFCPGALVNVLFSHLQQERLSLLILQVKLTVSLISITSSYILSQRRRKSPVDDIVTVQHECSASNNMQSSGIKGTTGLHYPRS